MDLRHLRHRAEAYPPTGLYHNLLRLRWGAGAARDPEGGVLPGFHGAKMVVSLRKMVQKWWFHYGKWWKNGGLTGKHVDFIEDG